MKLTSNQKVKFVMSVNLIVLFVMIVVTPNMIEYGVLGLPESFIEGCFLAVEVLALFLIFRHFEFILREQEREFESLDLKLKKREKELISTFQYLGKMNVQFSMFKTIFEKMKVPDTRGQLKIAYSDLLRIVCSFANKDCAGLKLIDLDSGRTVGEFYEKFSEDGNNENKAVFFEKNPGNKDLIKSLKNGRTNICAENDNFSVIYSNFNSFSVKAFIFFPQNEKSDFKKEEKDFLEAVANQCEIFFLLFNSGREQKRKAVNGG